MPKRVDCSECRVSLSHQKRFQIIEVIGRLSGQSSKIIAQYCENCYKKFKENEK